MTFTDNTNEGRDDPRSVLASRAALGLPQLIQRDGGVRVSGNDSMRLRARPVVIRTKTRTDAWDILLVVLNAAGWLVAGAQAARVFA